MAASALVLLSKSSSVLLLKLDSRPSLMLLVVRRIAVQAVRRPGGASCKQNASTRQCGLKLAYLSIACSTHCCINDRTSVRLTTLVLKQFASLTYRPSTRSASRDAASGKMHVYVRASSETGCGCNSTSLLGLLEPHRSKVRGDSGIVCLCVRE